MATPDHIVDVPLDDDSQKPEAGSPVKSKDDALRDLSTATTQTPISLKIAGSLWIVCSVLIAVLDYSQSQTTDYTRLALTAVTIGLVLASVIFLTLYGLNWTASRKQEETLAGSTTPVEVVAAQGIVYV